MCESVEVFGSPYLRCSPMGRRRCWAYLPTPWIHCRRATQKKVADYWFFCLPCSPRHCYGPQHSPWPQTDGTIQTHRCVLRDYNYCFFFTKACFPCSIILNVTVIFTINVSILVYCNYHASLSPNLGKCNDIFPFMSGSLEVFHSTMLKYTPKRLHFFYDSMLARTMLAVIDHNVNVGRQLATTKTGNHQTIHLYISQCLLRYRLIKIKCRIVSL